MKNDEPWERLAPQTGFPTSLFSTSSTCDMRMPQTHCSVGRIPCRVVDPTNESMGLFVRKLSAHVAAASLFAKLFPEHVESGLANLFIVIILAGDVVMQPSTLVTS